MNRKNQYSLLILAGGKSTRMGKNKAELLYGGKTFTKLLISKAEKMGINQIYISGFQEKKEKVRIVWDIYPDRGPLGGFHACFKEMSTPFCLVLPVDVPQIPLGVLEELLTYHERNGASVNGKEYPLLLEHGERKEYLIGIYPISMVDFIEGLIREQPVSVHDMLGKWGYYCCRMELPEWQVDNINTQEAYRALLLRDERGQAEC